MTAAEVIARCRELAACSEEPGMTTRRFLSPPMRDVHARLTRLMETPGRFDPNPTNYTGTYNHKINETIHLALSNPVGTTLSTTKSRGLLTITDNDVPTSGIKLSASFYANAESGNETVTVSRTATTTAQTVTLATSDNGTAAAGVDYTPVNTPVSFAVGEATKSVAIPILADTLFEGNESFILTLTDGSGGSTRFARPRSRKTRRAPRDFS